jgi:hypothetical protein
LVSADGLTVSHVGAPSAWLGALVEPAVSSAERCYAEWVIEVADPYCSIMLGVTDLEAAPPAGQYLLTHPGSRLYYCADSKAYPGSRNWGATGRRTRGDRVGLLVERGGVSVYVNGARLGPGPMATDLPPRVRVLFSSLGNDVSHPHTSAPIRAILSISPHCSLSRRLRRQVVYFPLRLRHGRAGGKW